MFKFFTTKEWLLWSWLGLIAILSTTWYMVSLDVMINEWFGDFYNTLQEALAKPNSVTLEEFIAKCFTFAGIAAIYIAVAVVLGFFTSHWTFRWRKSMADYYHRNWNGGIEGASQRVQEDTLKFARITEDLGIGFVEAMMVLGAFMMILWELSKQVTHLPWIGEVSHALVWVVVLTAIGGTVLLMGVGYKLPGIEYDIQKEEARYRKSLVLAEDDDLIGERTFSHHFKRVTGIHYKAYFHYAYFNVAKFSYLQGMVIVPYLALSPTIVSGAVTLGFISQITRAFGKVAESLQYLVRSWTKIVELISVWKRLREFERHIELINEQKKLEA